MVPGLQPDFDLIVFRQPDLPPVVNDNFSIKPHFDATVRVGLQLIIAGRGRNEFAFPTMPDTRAVGGDEGNFIGGM